VDAEYKHFAGPIASSKTPCILQHVVVDLVYDANAETV
jgi:hypothetical protein